VHARAVYGLQKATEKAKRGIGDRKRSGVASGGIARVRPLGREEMLEKY